MKRSLIVVLVVGLIAGLALAAPAEAKKKKKKATPVQVKLYAHGTQQFGEAEIADAASGIYMKMDTTEPTGAQPKSMGLLNYGGGPNTLCAGNALFPVWVGDVTGTIVGNVTVNLSSIAGPASQVEVRIWPDVSGQACNDTYPEPPAAVTVDLPAGPGETEAVIEGVNFPATAKLMMQVSPVIPGTTQGRILYDAPANATSVSFSCIPATGTSCTP